MKHYRAVAALLSALLWFLPQLCAAQKAPPYPSKPIRAVIAQLPGGTADAVLRMFADKMGDELGERIIVDNRAGSGVAGLSALELVAHANPDGYTMLLVVPSFTFLPALVKDMPVDPAKDFAFVTLLNRDPYLLTLYPGLPAKNVKEFIALAKSKPNTLNAGGGNFGSGTHLVMAYFLHASGVGKEVTYVPYKGTGTAYIDLMAGRLQAAIASIVTGRPYVNSGRMTALAVTGAKRSEGLPDVPTVAEQGVPGFSADAWNGLVVPAKTPVAIINRLAAAAAAAGRSPEIRERLRAQGSEVMASTPAEFRQMINEEIPRWKKLIKELGVTPGGVPQ